MKGANSPWRELRRRCKTGRSSPGILFRRRSLAYAVAVVAMGNITVIRIGLGKTRRLRRERGKRASNDNCDDDSLNAQKKEGRGGSSSTAAEVCFLPRKFGMDHRNRPRAEKRQSISGSSSEQNETELLQCFVGSLSEGAGKTKREAGRTQSKFDHDMQMTAAASIPFRSPLRSRSGSPSLSPLSPLRLD